MTFTTIAGRQYDLSPQQVEAAVAGQLPEPVSEHFVVVSGRAWPPEQVIALVTGLDRADFTTRQACRILTRLGFSAARKAVRQGHPGGGPAAGPTMAERAEALRPYIGQWVALRDDEVLVAADSPKEIVGWLVRHEQRAQAMFRVPVSEEEITGAAPL